MSPPINLDGDTVDAITMDGDSVSEVTVDRDVVFDPGPPDTVTYQWTASTFSAGDADWTDDIQSKPMALTGDPQAVTLSNGGAAVKGDDTDHGLASIPDTLNGVTQAYEFSIQYSHSNLGIWGVLTNSNVSRYELQLNVDETFSTDNGNLTFVLRDEDDNKLKAAPTTNPNLDDGNVHKVSIDVVDSSQNDLDIYIDGSSVSLSFDSQQNPDNFNFTTDASDDFGFWARNNGGTITSSFTAAHGVHRFHNDTIGGQTI